MREQYQVKKIETPIDWKVSVPGSKSMTNRALLMAALSAETVEVEGVLFSDDSRHFLNALVELGFALNIDEARRRVTVTGCSGVIPKKEADIYVGSAGTAARFLTAMLGFSDGVYTVDASGQMRRRPMKPLFELLRGIGAKITCLEEEGHLPIRIQGCRYADAVAAKKVQPGENGGSTACLPETVFDNGVDGSGSRTAGKITDRQAESLYVELDISKSTQFLSALLLVSPMIKQGLHIHITSEKADGSYIRITRSMMEDFGAAVSFDGRDYEVAPQAAYRKSRYTVEPDMSAACYFYAAAAVTGGSAVVNHVHMDNTQGDRRFLDVLRQMGCTVRETEAGISVTGPKGGRLKAVSVNMNDFSDQALTLAAIAPFADGAVRITGIGHIRGQECDRIHAIVTELSRLNIRCEEEADAVTVYPGMPGMATVETYEDHRVAMAFALTGLRTGNITIDNPGCCGKTFEEYFTLLDALVNGQTENEKTEGQ